MYALDDADQEILQMLLQDSRTSLKTLGQRVGLSSPSVAERLRDDTELVFELADPGGA